MKQCLMTWGFVLSVSCSALAQDAFEPDDQFAVGGAGMDGASPDFTVPANNLPESIWIWRVDGRNLSSFSDRDFIVHYLDQYPYCPVSGEIRIVPVDSYSASNLRVEVVGYPRGYGLNGGSPTQTYQRCTEATSGGSVIPVGRGQFSTFYRIRSCNNAVNVNYRFEFHMLDAGFCYAPTNITGTVVNADTGQVSPGAYIYTNENSITFSSLETGEFELAVTQDSNLVLDFLSPSLESLGAVNIGPVPVGSRVDGVTLYGAIPSLFRDGFE